MFIFYQYQNWVAHFRFRNFDVNDEPHHGRSIIEKVYEMLQKIEVNWIASWGITTEPNIDYKTLLNHTHKSRYQKKLNIWVPNKLIVKNWMGRVYICFWNKTKSSHLWNEWLWVVKSGLHRKILWEKIFWSKPGEASQSLNFYQGMRYRVFIWWDWKGIVHHELLKPDQTINLTLLPTTNAIEESYSRKMARIQL